MNDNEIHAELLNTQLKNTDNKYKLSYKDLMRLVKYIDFCFFSESCCIWKGVINPSNNNITFYHSYEKGKGRKVSLMRLLWRNLGGVLNDEDRIESTCHIIGCVNLSHHMRYYYE